MCQCSWAPSNLFLQTSLGLILGTVCNLRIGPAACLVFCLLVQQQKQQWQEEEEEQGRLAHHHNPDTEAAACLVLSENNSSARSALAWAATHSFAAVSMVFTPM